MSDLHIVVIFNDYYTQIVAFFDQTDAEQKQKQTCCKPTANYVLIMGILNFDISFSEATITYKKGSVAFGHFIRFAYQKSSLLIYSLFEFD